MSPRDVAIRSNLDAALSGAAFPATRESLLRYLDQIVASGPVVNASAALPSGREYANPGDVADAASRRAAAARFKVNRSGSGGGCP